MLRISHHLCRCEEEFDDGRLNGRNCAAEIAVVLISSGDIFNEINCT